MIRTMEGRRTKGFSVMFSFMRWRDPKGCFSRETKKDNEKRSKGRRNEVKKDTQDKRKQCVRKKKSGKKMERKEARDQCLYRYFFLSLRCLLHLLSLLPLLRLLHLLRLLSGERSFASSSVFLHHHHLFVFNFIRLFCCCFLSSLVPSSSFSFRTTGCILLTERIPQTRIQLLACLEWLTSIATAITSVSIIFILMIDHSTEPPKYSFSYTFLSFCVDLYHLQYPWSLLLSLSQWIKGRRQSEEEVLWVSLVIHKKLRLKKIRSEKREYSTRKRKRKDRKRNKRRHQTKEQEFSCRGRRSCLWRILRLLSSPTPSVGHISAKEFKASSSESFLSRSNSHDESNGWEGKWGNKRRRSYKESKGMKGV